MNFSGRGVLLLSIWAGHPPDWLDAVQDNHSRYAQRHAYDLSFVVEEFPRDSALQSLDPLPGPPDRPSTASIQAVWRQIEAVRSALQDSSVTWVFKSDCDSLFMNWSQGLGDLQDLSHDFVFTGDAWDLFNGGHFLIRNTAFTRDLLDVWLRFAQTRVPALFTTHQSSDGIPSDQPAMNVILHGGLDVTASAFVDTFNSVNGFVGNPQRRRRHFQYTHAPTRRWRLGRARSLIHPSLADRVAVVDQNRMNSYPSRLPGARSYTAGDPILHLVGAKEKSRLFADHAIRQNS